MLTVTKGAVVSSVLHPAIVCGRLAVLAGFRRDFYDALTARRDELFELADAVLCTDGAVKTLVELALAPEHQRGHGALYDGINHGGLEIGRLRRAITGAPLPRAADGRLVLAVDVSPWLRPDANTSPDRCFCHTYGRGKDEHRMIPGWPYSFVAALESGGDLVDRDPRRDPAPARRRRRRDHRHATARGRRTAAGRRALDGRRPGDPHR